MVESFSVHPARYIPCQMHLRLMSGAIRSAPRVTRVERVEVERG